MLFKLRPDFGKVKILLAREQRACKRIAGIQRMACDLAERGDIRRRPEIEFSSREFFNRRRSVFTNRTPRVENVFDSHHIHIVAKPGNYAAAVPSSCGSPSEYHEK